MELPQASSVVGNGAQDQITVLIVEDQLICRVGLRAVIENFPDMEILGEADNGQSAVNKAKSMEPSIIIMDVSMPLMDGIEATKQIKECLLSSKILILTSHERENDVFGALAAGADGYCLKTANALSLATAIRTVHLGAFWLDPAIARRVLNVSAEKISSVSPEKSNSQQNNGNFGLTVRENEVLELLVEGMTNQQMADHLCLSGDTIKSHMRRIMEKLAVSDRTQAAVKALKNGLLGLPPKRWTLNS